MRRTYAQAGISLSPVTNVPALGKLAVLMPQDGRAAHVSFLCTLAAVWRLVNWSGARTGQPAPLRPCLANIAVPAGNKKCMHGNTRVNVSIYYLGGTYERKKLSN